MEAAILERLYSDGSGWETNQQPKRSSSLVENVLLHRRYIPRKCSRFLESKKYDTESNWFELLQSGSWVSTRIRNLSYRKRTKSIRSIVSLSYIYIYIYNNNSKCHDRRDPLGLILWRLALRCLGFCYVSFYTCSCPEGYESSTLGPILGATRGRLDPEYEEVEDMEM